VVVVLGLLLYQTALFLCSPLVVGYLLYGIFVSKKLRHSWKIRLGYGWPDVHPETKLIHLHAASVGEVVGLIPIVKELRRLLPDYQLLVTTLSETGQTMAKTRLAPDYLTFLPLDYPFIVRSFFEHFSPRLILAMETELWPTLISKAKNLGIPVVIANGRISPGTERRYHWFSALYRPLAASLTAFLAQSEAHARRARDIGVRDDAVEVLGDVKYDQVLDNPTSSSLADIRANFRAPGSKVIVAGSTHPGEHDSIIEHFSRLSSKSSDNYLILAPRHPQTIASVERLLKSHELDYVLRSAQRGGTVIWTDQAKVLLVDTMGELAYLYEFGTVVFVGGSLVPIGGHSPLEPAILGKPVIFGPQAFNFEDMNEILETAGGARLVRTAEELFEVAIDLLDKPITARAMGIHAREAVLANSGASRATAEYVKAIISREQPSL